MHPVLSGFIRTKLILGLVAKGKSVHDARDMVGSMSDSYIRSTLVDAGVSLPEAPAGGWGAWILANLPAIIADIMQLLALFGG